MSQPGNLKHLKLCQVVEVEIIDDDDYEDDQDSARGFRCPARVLVLFCGILGGLDFSCPRQGRIARSLLASRKTED